MGIAWQLIPQELLEKPLTIAGSNGIKSIFHETVVVGTGDPLITVLEGWGGGVTIYCPCRRVAKSRVST